MKIAAEGCLSTRRAIPQTGTVATTLKQAQHSALDKGPAGKNVGGENASQAISRTEETLRG